MQRCKGRCGVQLMQYLFVDQAMLPQPGAAMHDAVTDRDGDRRIAVVEEFSDTGNRALLVGDGSRLGQPRIVAEILRVKLATLLADRFRLSAQQQIRCRWADTV